MNIYFYGPELHDIVERLADNRGVTIVSSKKNAEYFMLAPEALYRDDKEYVEMMKQGFKDVTPFSFEDFIKLPIVKKESNIAISYNPEKYIDTNDIFHIISVLNSKKFEWLFDTEENAKKYSIFTFDEENMVQFYFNIQREEEMNNPKLYQTVETFLKNNPQFTKVLPKLDIIFDYTLPPNKNIDLCAKNTSKGFKLFVTINLYDIDKESKKNYYTAITQSSTYVQLLNECDNKIILNII